MTTDSLTSLAILKVNWDNQGHDYIENFVPFVAEALRLAPQDTVSVAQIQGLIKQTFGLIIPQGALNMLLKRAAKRGLVRREAGVYIRTGEVSNEQFQQLRATVN